LPDQRPAPGHAAAETERADDRELARDQPGPGDRKPRRRLEGERDPGGNGAKADRPGGSDQRPAPGGLERGAGERRSGDDDADGEDDLERRLERHASIVKRVLR